MFKISYSPMSRDLKEEFCFVFSAVIMTLEMKLFYLQFIEKKFNFPIFITALRNRRVNTFLWEIACP